MEVMVVGRQTALLVELALGREVTTREIEDALIARAIYLDESKWCQNLADALGLPGIELKTIDNKFVPLRISLDGITEPINDPRVLQAAVHAMRFRKVAAIGVEADGSTIILHPGHETWIRTGTGISATTISSSMIITTERLAAVERQGGALHDLLGLQAMSHRPFKQAN
jgi:hypothetical protein